MSKYYVEYGALQANGKRLIECETSALDAEKITEDFAREIAYALNARDELADVEKTQVPTQGKTSAVGNEAEMREALIWMKERMNAAIHDGSFDCDEALEKIDAALSAPPRNCDVFPGDGLVDEFCRYMGFDPMDPKNGYADGQDRFMRDNWFLFSKWITRPYDAGKTGGQ